MEQGKNHKTIALGIFLIVYLSVFAILLLIIPQQNLPKFIYIVLTLGNLIIVMYAWGYIYKEDKKKNEIIKELRKSLISQEEFFVNISHELKTPLNVMSSAVQLLRMYCNKGSLDDRRDIFIKYLESIKLNSFRLSKLINNIVESSKIKAGFLGFNMSNNDIVQVVEEIVTSVNIFVKSKGLNITFDTDIEEKVIVCDPEKIERILLNLLSNAVKFSDKGGEIFPTPPS